MPRSWDHSTIAGFTQILGVSPCPLLSPPVPPALPRRDKVPQAWQVQCWLWSCCCCSFVVFFSFQERGEELGTIVPAFEILFEDFIIVVGWFFPVGIYSNAASSLRFLESSTPCFPARFFFLPNPFSLLLPSPDDPCAVALRHPHGFFASFVSVRVVKPSLDKALKHPQINHP